VYCIQSSKRHIRHRISLLNSSH